MAARVRLKIAVAVSSNPDNEERDLGNVNSEVVCDGVSDGGTWQMVLAPNSTDVPCQLTQLAAGRLLAVRAFSNDANVNPVAITMKKNGTGGEPWTLSPLPNTKEANFVCTSDGLTALYFSNASTTVAMRVIVVMAGD